MKVDIKRILNSERGKYVLSILLGLGLATLFRKSCNRNKCLVFKAPNLNQVKDKIFGYNNKCYKFHETNITCNQPNTVLLDIYN